MTVNRPTDLHACRTAIAALSDDERLALFEAITDHLERRTLTPAQFTLIVMEAIVKQGPIMARVIRTAVAE